MKIAQGWLIETKKGICYRLLITDGHYVGIHNALKLYSGRWYLIKTTDLIGTEKEIIDLINEKNEVDISAEWEKDEERSLLSFKVKNKDGEIILTLEDIRVLQDKAYRI